MTVKTVEPCRTDFISSAELIELMERSRAAAHAIVRLLSHELTELTDRAKSLLLPQTARGRLANLLLEWSEESDLNQTRAARIDRLFTQEEIAQMICSSRETVTRLLATLGRRQIIRVSSDSILIRDRAALEAMALG
jgi:CRP/FNR family transcriptional regulator